MSIRLIILEVFYLPGRVARGAPSVNFSLRKFTPPGAAPVAASVSSTRPPAGLYSTRQEMKTEAHVAVRHLRTFLAKREEGREVLPEQIRIWFGELRGQPGSVFLLFFGYFVMGVGEHVGVFGVSAPLELDKNLRKFHINNSVKSCV